MGKRANGEGTIYQRKDGRWCATISIEKAKRKHFLGKTRAEVAKKLTSALEAAGQRHARHRSAADRTSVLRAVAGRRAAVPAPAHVRPLRAVRTPSRPAGPWRADTDEGRRRSSCSGSTRRGWTRALADDGQPPARADPQGAVERGPLGRWCNRNVADLVDPPRNRHFEIATLTAEQARAFLDAAAGNRLEALFVLAVTTGMRQGELLGLRWRDVDLDAGMLQIRGSMQATPDGLRIMEPKTPGSRRQVALSKQPIDALRRHRVAQAAERLRIGAAWEDGDLVFCSAAGRPITASGLRRSYEPLLKRAGLPRMRFHDLRHTSATLLLGRGVHPKVVSEMLGHTRISTTLDLYSHVSMTMQQQAAEAFDAILGS